MEEERTTRDKVFEFMMKYQEEKGGSVSLEEIAEAQESLNYRSSAQYVVRQLVAEGRVVPSTRTGTSRRYRAVENPVAPLDEMGMHFLHYTET